MRVIVAICAALLLAPTAAAQLNNQSGETSAGHPLIEREGESPIIGFDGGDDVMNAAITDARMHLPHFWERMAAGARGEGGFTLKVAFNVESNDGTTREHIWVEGIQRRGAGFVANLANEPNWMPGQHLGDEVSFTESMISDWGYSRRRKMIGFYTIRVMLDEMPAEAADYLRAALGPNPK
jgi:uncharacterized protein YegJ (DUF2314 family)